MTAGVGAAFLSTELCRKVWDALLPERWALRSCGQLLVLRRYDDIYRHASAEQTPPSNLMVWDCWEERWACGSCMCDFPIPQLSEDLSWGYPNAGVVSDVHPDFGFAEHRLLVHAKVGDTSCVYRSSPLCCVDTLQ